MAEEIKNEEVVEEVEQEEVDTQESTEQQLEEEMIPKSQMEQIIKDRVAREKKATEKAVEEAKKLAKMNEDEKREFELEKLQEELAEMKQKEQRYQMSQEATKMLSEADIPYDDGLIGLVTSDDADTTKERVQAIVSLSNKIRKERARQSTPPAGGGFADDKSENKDLADIAKEKRIIKS